MENNIKIIKTTGFIIILTVLSSCSSLNDNSALLFLPQQVSCIDISSSKLRAKIETIYKNPDGDLYLVAHANEILSDLKKSADSGNVKSMYEFGSFKREFLVLKNMQTIDRYDSKVHFFLDDSKDEIIIAMTYIYLAASMAQGEENHAKELSHAIEKKSFDINVPAEWLDEAKANARNWQEYCLIHKDHI